MKKRVCVAFVLALLGPPRTFAQQEVEADIVQRAPDLLQLQESGMLPHESRHHDAGR